MIAYTSHMKEEIEQMEREEYNSNDGKLTIKFKFGFFPADMKRTSKMSGELNNNATYFSPFANVNQDNKCTIGGSIGEKTHSVKVTWNPSCERIQSKVA